MMFLRALQMVDYWNRHRTGKLSHLVRAYNLLSFPATVLMFVPCFSTQYILALYFPHWTPRTCAKASLPPLKAQAPLFRFPPACLLPASIHLTLFSGFVLSLPIRTSFPLSFAFCAEYIYFQPNAPKSYTWTAPARPWTYLNNFITVTTRVISRYYSPPHVGSRIAHVGKLAPISKGSTGVSVCHRLF